VSTKSDQLQSTGAFVGWWADFSAAATGYTNGFVVAGLVRSDAMPQPTYDVGLTCSNDEGSTFTTAIRISDPNSGGSDPLAPSDGPLVAADPAHHYVWIWWWGQSNTFVRRVYVGPQCALSPDAPIDLTAAGLANQNLADHSLFTIAPPGTFQSLPTTTLFLVYRDQYLLADWGCPNQTLLPVTWTLAWSTDNGGSWSTIGLGTDPDWPECLSDNANGGDRFRGQAAFDWLSGEFMFSLSRPIHDSNHDYVGMRSILYEWPSINQGTANVDYWIPLCNPTYDPGTGELVELINGMPPPSETFCNQFGSTVATTFNPYTGASNAAMTWYSTVDSTSPPNPPKPVMPGQQWQNFQVDVWGASVRPGAPFDYEPATMSRITPLGPGVPWTPLNPGDNTWWGDYQQTTADSQTGTFVTTFTYDVAGPAYSTIYAASFNP
jgi:hypothetical protein